MQPLDGAVPGTRAGCQAALQQVAARGRFPVDHLPGHENARNPAQHEPSRQFAPADASRGGNRFGNRARSRWKKAAILHLGCERCRGGEGPTGGKDRECPFAQAPAGAGLFQEFDRVFCGAQFGGELFAGEGRFEIDAQFRRAPFVFHFTKSRA